MDEFSKVSQPGMVYLALSAMLRGMQPGAQMPSYKELRKCLGVPQRSIDLAYERYEAEGVLTRQWGRGTFVIDPFAGGTFIFLTDALYLTQQTGMYSLLEFIAIDELLQQHYPSSELELIVLHSNEGSGDSRDNDILRRIRGLNQHMRLLGAFAGFCIGSQEVRATFRELKIPLVDLNNVSTPYSVLATRMDAELELGLSHLVDEGWKDIAIVCNSEGSRKEVEAYIQSHGLMARTAAPTLRLYAIEEGFSRHWEEFGIRFIKDFLKYKPLPEAFLILDDVICKGVLYGALEEGMQLAERCAMVSVSNEGIPIRASRPLTCIEYSAKAVGQEALSIMQQCFTGAETIERNTLRPRLVVGKSSCRADYPQVRV
jgi:DNA-binding LacI/PurR family transcriptional regulator